MVSLMLTLNKCPTLLRCSTVDLKQINVGWIVPIETGFERAALLQ